MMWLLLYAAAAIAFILWAARRLFLAWGKGYVKVVDDPNFGFETAQIYRTDKPRAFWFSVVVTSLLLVAALVLLYFICVDLISVL